MGTDRKTPLDAPRSRIAQHHYKSLPAIMAPIQVGINNSERLVGCFPHNFGLPSTM